MVRQSSSPGERNTREAHNVVHRTQRKERLERFSALIEAAATLGGTPMTKAAIEYVPVILPRSVSTPPPPTPNFRKLVLALIFLLLVQKILSASFNDVQLRHRRTRWLHVVHLLVHAAGAHRCAMLVANQQVPAGKGFQRA